MGGVYICVNKTPKNLYHIFNPCRTSGTSKKPNTMKTASILILSLFALCFFQNDLEAQNMTQGTKVIQAGIGLGGWGGTAYTSQTPIISATLEMGVWEV